MLVGDPSVGAEAGGAVLGRGGGTSTLFKVAEALQEREGMGTGRERSCRRKLERMFVMGCVPRRNAFDSTMSTLRRCYIV